MYVLKSRGYYSKTEGMIYHEKSSRPMTKSEVKWFKSLQKQAIKVFKNLNQ